MASKSQLLQVVIHICHMSLHIKISRVLHAFRSFCSEAEARGNPKDIFDEVVRLLDDPVVSLKHPRISAPSVMLMDLMMCQVPQMFGLALEAFSTHILQADNFFYHLEKVVLLSPTQQQLFRDVRADVDELGHLIYSFENWGVDDQFSTMDNPKIERYQKLCAKLRMLCCAGDRDATRKQVQDMIYETEFVSHVTYVIRLKPKDFHKTCQEVLMQTIVQVCSIGTAFARGNPKNQHALYAIVEDALWLMQGNAATLDPTKVGLDASAGHLSGDQP